MAKGPPVGDIIDGVAEIARRISVQPPPDRDAETWKEACETVWATQLALKADPKELQDYLDRRALPFSQHIGPPYG